MIKEEQLDNIVSSVQVEDDNLNYMDEQFKRYIELNTENPDFAGWIKIDGAHINYPVMKSSMPDYYLHRNFNKEYSYYGTPYLTLKAKEKVSENASDNSEGPVNYAIDKVQNNAKSVSDDAIYLFNKQGKKSVNETVKNTNIICGFILL